MIVIQKERCPAEFLYVELVFLLSMYWATPQYGWDFPEEIPENFRKDPGNALRVFPGIPLESTAGIPQALQFKAFEGSRAFPEFSPPQYGWGRFFFFRSGSGEGLSLENPNLLK